MARTRKALTPKPPPEPKEFPIGFALHQMKNEGRFRDMVVARPGHTLVEFDAAGQEFRWMAIASGDPTMLQLCMPGEDAHSFMGARISHIEYHELMKRRHDKTDKEAGEARKAGKVGNLCIADTPILTDRGYVSIQCVSTDDKVWDGVEFVSHDGVICSGFKDVITHDGVSATPEHGVWVDERWVSIAAARHYGWTVTPALGKGWAGQCRSAVRIVDGIVRRAVHEEQCAVRGRALRLWLRAGSQFAVLGDRALDAVQVLRVPFAASGGRPPHQRIANRQDPSEACQRVVPAVQQPEGSILPQLRRAWDRVSVRLGERRRRVGQGKPATSDVQSPGHRPGGQQQALRTGEPTADYTQGQSAEQARSQPHHVAGSVYPDPGVGQSLLTRLHYALCGDGAFWRRNYHARPARGGGPTKGVEEDTGKARVYDIVNCGPRSRFAANGRIVHNSLQYRTSARKFCSVARVQYGMSGMTLPEAERIRFTYLKTYRKLPDYWESQITKTKQLGYVETFAGRRVSVVGDWSGAFGWSMGSTAINYRIQGTGGDQKYLALQALDDLCLDTDAAFLIDLHDGLYHEVPDGRVTEFCEKGKRILDNLPYEWEWGFTPPIPLTWDCKFGKTWGSMKELEL